MSKTPRSQSKSKLTKSHKSEIKLNFDSFAFSELSLSKFCTKKLHEIEIITDLTPECGKFLDELTAEGKKYEYLSFVHFIKYEDIVKLAEDLQSTEPNKYFPRFMLDHLKKTAGHFLEMSKHEPEKVSVELLAVMIKMKIIEIMCVNYYSEVQKINKRKRLNDELAELVKNAGGGDKKDKKGKKGKKEKKEKPSKKKSKETSASSTGTKQSFVSSNATKKPSFILDTYPQLPLEESDIVFDYNLNHQAMFFVLVGFKQIDVIQQLSKILVNISAIIEISSKPPPNQPLDNFIIEIHKLFNSSTRNEFLDSTVLMKYEKSSHSDLKENLERLIYTIKRILYMKRQHLAYIKNLKLYNFGDPPSAENVACLKKYCRILDEYPPELTNVPLIVDALVQEVCWREAGKIYSWSDFSSLSSASASIQKFQNTYQIHEEDLLGIQVNSYRNKAGQVYDSTIRMLRLLKPFHPSPEPPAPRPKITRNIAAPDDDVFYPTLEKLYDYFHLIHFNKMERIVPEPKQLSQYDFIKNLVTYNEAEEFEKMAAVLPTKPEMATFFRNKVLKNYHLKEDLSESVTLQLIYNAFIEFSHFERFCCEESESVLLRFHNNVDNFGMNTQIWNEFLPSVVCLKDFCKYTSVDCSEWIEKNRVIESDQIGKDASEQCEGLYTINKNGIYKEYSFLFNKEESLHEKEEPRSFGQLLDELLHYPASNNLKNFFTQSDTGEKALAVYDLGPKRVQLTGKTTVFHSVDNVKVTIDTSRFLSEEPRCAVNVNMSGFRSYFRTDDLKNIHFLLPDDTIINISSVSDIRDKKVMQTLFVNKRQKSESQKSVQVPQSLTISVSSLGRTAIDSEDEEMPQTSVLEDAKIENVNFDEFLAKHNLHKSEIHFESVVNPEKFMSKIEEALDKHRKIYKLSNRANSTKVAAKNMPSSLIARLIKRVLFKPPKNLRKYPGYSCIFNPEKYQAQKYQLSITLPDGLTLTSMPKTQNGLMEIKQTYKFTKNTMNEQYRAFYQNGTVLIKHCNGSTTLLHSNGDIIKLTEDLEEASDSCDCRRVLPKLNRCTGGSEETLIAPSRCDPPIERNASSMKNLQEFAEIPYVRKTVLRSDGNQITEFKGRVTEKQVFYVVNEDDYPAQEKYYERDDGMRQLMTLSGKKTIQFPDGTMITSSVVIEKKLIYIEPKTDGWVSISINYKFEHPKYIPLMYNGRDLVTHIVLNNTVLKCGLDVCTMCNSGQAIEVTESEIFIVKTCKSCDAECFCKITAKSDRLVDLYDSYGKHLICDMDGNVELRAKRRHSDGFDKSHCCHYKRNEHYREKLFVLNNRRGGSGAFGSLWWVDALVDHRILNAESNKNATFKNYINKLIGHKQTLEFFTNIYQEFTERFTNSLAFKKKLSLSKYKQKDDGKTNKLRLYVTFRILYVCSDVEEFETIQQELLNFLENYQGISESFVKAVKEMHEFLKFWFEKGDGSTKSMYQVGVKNDFHGFDGDVFMRKKSKYAELIANWKKSCEHYKDLIRNRKFPLYFHSNYYKNQIK